MTSEPSPPVASGASVPERSVNPTSAPAPGHAAGMPAHGRRWGWLVVTLLVIVAAGSLILWWNDHGQNRTEPAQSSGDGAHAGTSEHTTTTSAGNAAPGNGTATPGHVARISSVVVATAHTADLPIYVAGLGTVTPFATVTIHTRVDGQLVALHYREGQLVHAGDALADIDAAPFKALLLQATGQRDRDQALLVNARVDLERYRKAPAAFTSQQVDTQRSLVDQLHGTVEADQGQVDAAQVQVSYCHITAPVDGVIGLRLVDTGNIVHASDANGLVVITTLQPITVVFTLGQDDIPRLRQAMHASSSPLLVTAFNRDLSQVLASGQLLAIDNQVDPSTGTVRLRARFANQDNQLFPNQFVNVRLLLSTLHGSVVIPTSGVQSGPDYPFAYVVTTADDVSRVSMRKITVGPSEGGVTSVTGIDEGDVVVIDGVDNLQPNAQVHPHPVSESAPPDASGAVTGHHHHHSADTTTAPGNTPSDATPSGPISPADDTKSHATHHD